jgi:hypothetical protein
MLCALLGKFYFKRKQNCDVLQEKNYKIIKFEKHSETEKGFSIERFFIKKIVGKISSAGPSAQ